MNILVLGNGFDIAHKLKTSYADFVKFYTYLAEFDVDTYKQHFTMNDTELSLDAIHYPKMPEVVIQLQKHFSLGIFVKIMRYFDQVNLAEGKALIQKCKNNYWLHYVNKQDEHTNKKWCFFEEIITKHLEAIAWLENHVDVLHAHDISKYAFLSNYKEIDEVIQTIGRSEDSLYNDHERIHCFKERLLQDLNDLIYLLDVYLTQFLNKPQDASSVAILFKRLPINRVINFNYTATYWNEYGEASTTLKNDYIHYIHGKASYGMKEGYRSNMVLGVGTKLHNTDEESIVGFAGFQKYFQRIIKKTGNDYVNWLDEMREDDTNHIIIFGHSLDVPDGDMIQKMVEAPTKITIFYYDEEALSSIVSNLVRTLTQDRVIQLTSSGIINFISCKQSEESMVKIAECYDISYTFMYM